VLANRPADERVGFGYVLRQEMSATPEVPI
jgi:hypothetical protein